MNEGREPKEKKNLGGALSRFSYFGFKAQGGIEAEKGLKSSISKKICLLRLRNESRMGLLSSAGRQATVCRCIGRLTWSYQSKWVFFPRNR